MPGSRSDVPIPSSGTAPASAWSKGLPWIALAFLVRLVDAARASEHLDDFHSLYHAGASSWSAFYAHLVQDNHPPLSFAVLRVVRALVGDHALLLRLPNVLYGTASVALVWRMGRRLPGGATRALATALIAFSALHVDLSSDLRMYALLGLCIAGGLDAFIDLACGERGRVRLALWVGAGLLTHYHAVHALAVLGLAALGLAAAGALERRRAWHSLQGALCGALCGVLLAAPWLATGFRAQLGHSLAPGGSKVSAVILGESLVHLVYLRLELLPGARWLLLGCGFALPMFALAGGILLLRRGPPPPRAVLLAWAALAFALPAWSALAAWLVPRAGFEWRYLAGAIAPFALLAGAFAAPGPRARLRTLALSVCAAAAAALSIAHAVDPGREDYAGAVRFIAREARAGDGLLAADWQPRLFPHGLGWMTLSARLTAAGHAPPPLALLPYSDEYALTREADLAALPRVFCLLRSLPDTAPMLASLRAAFPREAKLPFGEGVWVLVFER